MTLYQQINIVKSYFDDTVTNMAARYGLKTMEYHVLGFLKNYPDKDCAADIVRALQTTKSHISITVKSLAEKGLLTQQTMPGNNKTVHLKVTEQGEALIADSAQYFEEYIRTVWSGFTPEELILFRSFCDRFTENSLNGIRNIQKQP